MESSKTWTVVPCFSVHFFQGFCPHHQVSEVWFPEPEKDEYKSYHPKQKWQTMNPLPGLYKEQSTLVYVSFLLKMTDLNGGS